MIHYLKAKTSQQKIELLTQTVESLFQKGKRIQILVPNEDALSYIDQLLWSYKTDSFIPHAICQKPTDEIIVLTTQPTNLNQADALINLTPSPVNPAPFSDLYELLDETTPAKTEQSQSKLKHYQELMNASGQLSH